ncbi:MAG TPA: hypothetical protein PKC45_19305, partial [Gemmatales bacterium]|nr:hypothetical protein [Gemmatales bacterium]
LQARRFRSFVVYWCHEFNHEGAVQLAAVEGFSDRLPPTTLLQPCDVMEHLLRPAESNVCVWRAAA